MYICGSGNDFAVSFSYDFAVGFLNCSDGVVFVFHFKYVGAHVLHKQFVLFYLISI